MTFSFTTEQRQAWMATLSKATFEDLSEHVEGLEWPDYKMLRAPEIGLIMVRGKAGGNGEPFNLGEMTVTRCAVKLSGEKEIVGFGYVAGRSQQHAELAAVCDALMQHPDWREQVEQKAITPLRQVLEEKQRQTQEATAATKVNFFTMPRGE